MAKDAPLLTKPTKDTVIEHRQNDFAKAGIVDNDDGKAGLHSLRVNYINAVIRSGADLKPAWNLRATVDDADLREARRGALAESSKRRRSVLPSDPEPNRSPTRDCGCWR